MRADLTPRLRTVVMALLVLSPVAFVAGRATAPGRVTVAQAEAMPEPRALPAGVRTFHDASNEVTCWQNSEALSCLPDQWLASARIEAEGP